MSDEDDIRVEAALAEGWNAAWHVRDQWLAEAQVEAAARAIAKWDGDDWDTCGRSNRYDYLTCARAALLAAKEAKE